MKKITVEMMNGNVYETMTDSYISISDITKELNNDNTKFMFIGDFVFIKAQVWTIDVTDEEEIKKEEMAAVLERWSDK